MGPNSVTLVWYILRDAEQRARTPARRSLVDINAPVALPGDSSLDCDWISPGFVNTLILGAD